MLMKPQYILVVIVAWLIAIVSFIIPRLIFKQLTTSNTTLDGIANTINNLQTAIYTAMGIEIGILVTAMALLLRKQ